MSSKKNKIKSPPPWVGKKTKIEKESILGKKINFFSSRYGKLIFHLAAFIVLGFFIVIIFDYQAYILESNFISKKLPQTRSIKPPKGYDIDKNQVESEIEKLFKTDLTSISFNQKIPILMYHYFHEDNSQDSALKVSLTTTPESFEAQMKWLSDNGYKSLTLSQYFNAIAQKEALPPKAVLITVDDGYRDFFENGAPILYKYNQTATIFVIVNSVGSANYLDWDQIRLLQDQGIEIGSHSLSHPTLINQGGIDLKKELEESKEKIESEIGTKVNFFCYPGGVFDNRVAGAVQEAGYKGALTTVSGYNLSNNNLFALPRFRVAHGISLEYFAWLVENAYK